MKGEENKKYTQERLWGGGGARTVTSCKEGREKVTGFCRGVEKKREIRSKQGGREQRIQRSLYTESFWKN